MATGLCQDQFSGGGCHLAGPLPSLSRLTDSDTVLAAQVSTSPLLPSAPLPSSPLPFLPFLVLFVCLCMLWGGNLTKSPSWSDIWQEGMGATFATSLPAPFSAAAQGTSQAFLLSWVPLEEVFLSVQLALCQAHCSPEGMKRHRKCVALPESLHPGKKPAHPSASEGFSSTPLPRTSLFCV